MAATIFSVIDRRNSFATSAPFIPSAFTDNTTNADLLQIINDDGGAVIAAVDFQGNVQFNASGLTASFGAGGAGKYTVNRHLIGQFRTNPGSLTSTVAQAFAAAFPLNPQSWDIFQVIAPGGNIGYYVDSSGVAHGS